MNNLTHQFEKIGRGLTLIDKSYDALVEFISETTPGHNKLPSEEYLARQLGVSRTTIREALNRLVSDGLVSKVQGRGYYAHRSVHNLRNRIDLYPDIYKLLKENYGEAKLTIEDVEKRNASQESIIEFGKNGLSVEEVYCMRWAYSTHGIRIFVGFLEFPVSLIIRPLEGLDKTKSLPDFSERFMEHPITHCTMTMGACSGEEASRALPLKDKTKPTLYWLESIYNLHDEMVGCGIIYINTEVISPSLNASILE